MAKLSKKNILKTSFFCEPANRDWNVCVVQDVVADASHHGAPHAALTPTSQHHQLYARLLADLHDVVARVVSVLVHELEVDLQAQRSSETRNQLAPSLRRRLLEATWKL